MPGQRVSLDIVARFVDVAVEALAAAREEIDALNVYPVPDGDTGTNMFLTVSAARDALRAAMSEGEAAAGATGGGNAAAPDVVLAAFARGALLGARGNSGVILSQMLGAIAHRIAAAGPDERNATVKATALEAATDAAYEAVGTPVEGTMLTVARAAADAALARAAVPGARSREVFADAARAARSALARTPDQLQVLADAGVVDAGGRGVSVLLDAAENVLTGRRPPPVSAPFGTHHIPTPVEAAQAHDLVEGGPAYEVMYLLDAADEQIPALKTELAALGDSLVVVGGDGLWNVHVHVDDVGAAVEAGVGIGRPHRIRVTHFADQASAPDRQRRRSGRRLVAVAAGPGLRKLFEDAGATVVETRPGQRPSAGALLEAITACGAAEVVVLPNDPDSVRAAEIAARTAESDASGGLRVAVIPTVAQVQGLAALAVHEPGRGFDADVLEMTATARHARHGAVTVAVRQAMTMAGPCRPGDVLGALEGDFVVVGTDAYDVATDVLTRLLRGGGELVTIVAGADAGAAELARRCAAYVEEHHPLVEAVVYDGGQERYPVLVSVE